MLSNQQIWKKYSQEKNLKPKANLAWSAVASWAALCTLPGVPLTQTLCVVGHRFIRSTLLVSTIKEAYKNQVMNTFFCFLNYLDFESPLVREENNLFPDLLAQASAYEPPSLQGELWSTVQLIGQ